MIAPTSGISPRRAGSSRLLLWFLALTSFTVMATEVAAVGIERALARDLHVADGAAGSLVIAYSLGVAVGGPLLTLTLVRLDRRRLLSSLMAVFALSQVATALAPGLLTILLARAVSGLVAGACFATVTVTAYDVATPGRKGRALATVTLGITLATVAGAPLASIISSAAGWRAVFWLIAALAAAMAAGLSRLIPPSADASGVSGRRQLELTWRPSVRRALLTTVLVDPALFCAYTYLTPLLADRTGLNGAEIAGTLVAFGVGAAAGTHLGGRSWDRGSNRSLIAASIGIGLALLLLGATASLPELAVPACVLFGFSAFAAIPILQAAVVTQAAEAPLMAAAVNISAFNLANAIGAAAGALAIAGLGIAGPALVAGAEALLVAAGLALLQRPRAPAARSVSTT